MCCHFLHLGGGSIKKRISCDVRYKTDSPILTLYFGQFYNCISVSCIDVTVDLCATLLIVTNFKILF